MLFRSINHGGHPILAWMAGHAVRDEHADGAIKPSKKKSAEKIDGIVALITALERAMQGLKATTVVHICYGYGIEANIKWKESLGNQWRQYEQIFPWINQSSVKQVSLEFAGSRVPHDVLRLLPDKELLVGAIEVLPGKLETPAEVAHNILEATRHVEKARLLPCTNCGMAPLSAELARGKLRALGAGAAIARSRL